jgi:hypothetical protein
MNELPLKNAVLKCLSFRMANAYGLPFIIVFSFSYVVADELPDMCLQIFSFDIFFFSDRSYFGFKSYNYFRLMSSESGLSQHTDSISTNLQVYVIIYERTLH